MPLSFPPSPTVGQQSTQNGRVYSWTGRVWRLVSAVLASHASTHASGGSDAISIAASQITSGTIATARLASGTASSSTYLRGDQTWATVTAGVSSVNGATGDVTVQKTITSGTALPTGGSNGDIYLRYS